MTPARRELRVVAGLGGVALVNSVLMLAAPSALGASIFLPVAGIMRMLLLLAAVGFAAGGLVRLAGGGRYVLGGILATLATGVTLIALFVQTPQLPMNWVPALHIDVGAVAAGPISAGAAALAQPRWRIRLLGGAAVLVSIALAPARTST